MKDKQYWSIRILLVLVLAIALTACGEYGQVDQGRVINYDKEMRTVTIIRDMKAEPQKPDYTHLPPFTYKLPENPADMGPEPKTGGRMKLDVDKNQIIIFDQATLNFKTIDITIVDKKDNIDKTNPLVYDTSAGRAKNFPLVDRNKRTISVYSGRQKILVTFSVPDQYFSLPEKTWDAGDEVRIYYKEEGKAIRFMNISKTDIYKK